jgi:peroxiredoxin
MNTQSKPIVGAPMPSLSLPKIGGGIMEVGGKSDRWTLFIVYRGKHCPRCKAYLNTLEAMTDEWEEAGFKVAVTSADTQERAEADVEEFKWSMDISYGLSIKQMKTLGLYISEAAGDAIAPFAEPGLFCIDPEGNIAVAALSNAPFARPDLTQMLGGMKFTISKNLPIRGTVVA